MKTRTLLAIVFGAVFAIVVVSLAQTLVAFRQSLRAYSVAAAGHTQQRAAQQAVLAAAVDVETGVRGWLTTRDVRFRDRYDRVTPHRRELEDELIAAMHDDVDGSNTAKRIGEELDAWNTKVAEVELLPSIFDKSDAERRALEVDGKARMDAIRADLDVLGRKITEGRSSEAAALRTYEVELGSRILWTGVVVALSLALLGFWTLKRIDVPLARLIHFVDTGEPASALGKLSGVAEIASLGKALVTRRAWADETRDRDARFTKLVVTLSAGGSLHDVATTALTFLGDHHGARAGVIWFASEAKEPLEPIASLGVDPAALPEGGSALVRETRASGKAKRFDHLDDEGAHLIVSSLVTIAPRALSCVPMRAGDRLVGVVELVGPLDRDPDEELDRALERVAVALESAAARERADRLGEEVRAQNEQLEAQNEELRIQEEELRGQGELLVRQRSDLASHNKQLLDASTAQSAFLSSMSHELRTPLNAVIGFADILEAGTHGPLLEAQRGAIRDIQAAGRQLLNLVNDILDLAKVEAGRLTVDVGPIDAGLVVREACALLEPMARRRKVMLTKDADVVAACMADANRLRQVILNLVGNAIKFTPEQGAVTMTVESRGERVFVSVTDTGPGIRAEDVPKLFQAFSQLDGPATSLGTGLGLAIAKRLTELMGGELTLKSEVGRGSTFTVSLCGTSRAPVAAGSAYPRRPTPPTGMKAQRGRTGRFLVVEDERTDAQVLTGILSRAGHQVRVEGSGEAALTALSTQAFDVVLIDLNLPGISGAALIEAIRGQPALRSTALVVLTGATLDTAEREALRARVAFVAEKGVMTDAGFLGSLESLLAEKKGARVLVIDDNDANRRVARAMLQAASYEVIEASSGAEGIELARKARPDIVLMDMRMPGLTGIEATQALSEAAETAHIPVVAVSAQAMSGDRERALAAGCLDYVTKPLARRELLRVVDSVLSGRQAPEASR